MRLSGFGFSAALLLALAVFGAPGHAAGQTPPGAAQQTLFTVRHVVTDASGNLCLRFSQNLSNDPAIHYGDYLGFTPALKPALTVSGTDLCLGGLDAATTYKLTIRAGLPAASGAKLGSDQKFDLAVANKAPLVAIGGEGFILSRDTTNGLAIQTVNVDKLKIHVLRMSDKILPLELNPNVAIGNVALNTQTLQGYDLNNLLQNVAGVAWTGTMAVAADHNRTVTTAFPLAKVIPPGRNGLYLVVAENAAHAVPGGVFTAASTTNVDDEALDKSLAVHWVEATDLALSTMTGTDGLHVTARSLATAQPVANADLRLISTGLDVLGDVKTDASGNAAFPAALLAGSRANAATTLLAYGPDGSFAFQNLTGPAFDLSDRGVSGRDAPADLQAFMYTERGIYRPGETVDLVTLLRDRLGVAGPAMPLKLLVRRPDGVTDRSIVAPPGPAGGVFEPVKLSATAALGTWTVEAYADPTGAAIGRVTFDVQDFVPQQLRVSLSTDQKYMTPSDQVQAALHGDFLYGAPAAGLGAQGDLAVVRDTAPIPAAAGYSFGLVDDKVTDADSTLTLDNADGQGNLAISGSLPSISPTTVPLKAVLTAGLFEPSGRYVSDTVTVPIRSQKLLIGIKPRFSDNTLNSGDTAHFSVQTYDDAGNAIAHPGLTWTLVEENQIFDWFEDDSSNWTYHYHTEDQQISSGRVDVAAGKAADLVPTGLGQYDWGTYRLIVTDDATGSATSVRFDVGFDTTAGNAQTPDKAQVFADKALLQPGETTTLHIKGPFAGKAQIVLANDRVFASRMVDVPAGGATVPVTADAGWGAGAYAIVTMVRPLNAATPAPAGTAPGPQLPVRALGVAWLGIDPAAHRLAVSLGAPPKILPRQTVTVPLKIAGASAGQTPYVTLAAVDEGILQLTRYKTPDPLGYLYGKLKLGLDIRDDYGNLLDGSADAGAIQQGGDSGLGGPGLAVESTKVVSLFSGPVQVKPDGTAAIPIAVPDFEGQLRLVAVAYDAGQVGSNAAQMIVRDPVIADLALPRFLAPGDTAQLALSLHNTDGPAGAYHVTLTTAGPAAITATHKLDYTLAVGQRLQDAVSIAAGGIGVASIGEDVDGPNGYHIHRDWQIAIRSPHQPITLQQIVLAPKGSDLKLDPKLLTNFLPGTIRTSVGYSAYAGIDVPSLLQSLYTYPFGCTEQLSSTAFPLLYYNSKSLLGRARTASGADGSPAAVHDRVQTAIDSILDRQDGTGMFGLWAVGDGEASAWLNVYVMDFLLRAKAAGYDIPDDALNRGYANLQTLVQKLDSGAEGDSFTQAGLEAPQATLAYAEYVLARTGQADLSLLRRKHDAVAYAQMNDGAAPRFAFWQLGDKGQSSEDQLAQPLALGQLSAALALMGDKPRATDALQMATANIGVTDYPDWWFDDAYYTPQRDMAGLISLAAEEDDTQMVNALLLRLAALKLGVDDLNTQDKAWLLAAANTLNKSAGQVTLSVNGEAMPNLNLPVAFAPSADDIAHGYDIANASGRDLWRTLTVSGAPAHALPAFAHGYTLKKEFFTPDGQPVDPATLKQNDRVIVSLSGNVTDDDDHRTVLVDLLPAGWEIDGTIDDDSTTYTFLGPLTNTDVSEARDDRYVAAFQLGSGFQSGSGDSDDNADNSDSDNDNSGSSQDDSKPSLDPSQFHVAYLVRVITPGHYTLPEAQVNDMYRPALMARTVSAATSAAPR